MSSRISRQEYYLKLAKIASERATCSKLKVGAVLVRQQRIVAVGYNGAPSGWTHCNHVFNSFEGVKINKRDDHCKNALHAEMSVLLMCARFGIPTDGTVLYLTHFPCSECTKAIAQAGVKGVMYKEDYKNEENKNKHNLKIIKFGGKEDEDRFSDT